MYEAALKFPSSKIYVSLTRKFVRKEDEDFGFWFGCATSSEGKVYLAPLDLDVVDLFS